MSGIEDSPVASDWREILKRASSEFYARTGRGLLLSGVPAVLRQAGLNLSDVLGDQKLAPFLGTFGPPELQLIRSEENPTLWVILPGDVRVSSPLSQYFPRPRESEPESAIPRFHPAVWRCFVTHLETDQQRWINLNGNPFFFDKAVSESVEGALPIEREFVRTDSLFKSNETVASNIQAWAAKHNVPLSKITVSESRDHRPRESVLTAFLSSLTHDELTRVSLPADVVARLLGISRN